MRRFYEQWRERSFTKLTHKPEAKASLHFQIFFMTELIKQYQFIKTKYPDAIVLFRTGDFYKTFNEDAKIASKHIGITLMETTDHPTINATASLPFGSVDVALQKLVKAGYRVAICDQLEDPKKMEKVIVKRGVTDVTQPATEQKNLFTDL